MTRAAFRRTLTTALAAQVIAAAGLGFAGPAHARLSFDAPNPALATNTPSEASNDNQTQQAVAGDGAGGVLVVWTTEDSLGGTIGNDGDVVAASSSDGGLTWSGPVPVNSDAASDAFAESLPVVATDSAGVWIAAWSRDTGEILVARSTDTGATWSAPITVFTAAIGATASVSGLDYGNGSTWLLLANTTDDLGATIGNDQDIVVFSSPDAGLTWSAPTPVNVDAVSDGTDSDESARMTTDNAGNWVAVWRGDGVEAALSPDNGASWSGPRQLASEISASGEGPSVATDSAGTWLAVWSSNDPLGNTVGADADVLGAGSTNNGITWSSPVAVPGDADIDDNSVDLSPTIHHAGGTRWVVYWDSIVSGSKPFRSIQGHGIMTSRSRDGGMTWTDRGLVNTDATLKSDGLTDRQSAALVAEGIWVVSIHSTASFDSAVGSDPDIVVTRSEAGCPAVPAVGCKSTEVARGSRVKFKNKPGEKDTLGLTITRGEDTSNLEIGQPTTTDDFLVCLYDGVAGVSTLVMEKDLPAAALCKGKPCWKLISNGYSYKDPRHEHGAVRNLTIKGGLPGTGLVKLKARGATMMTPIMPFEADPGLVFQLHNAANGTCWEAIFSRLQANTEEQLKAKSD